MARQPDNEHPTEATIQGLLEDIASVYPAAVFGDPKTWATSKAAAWHRILKGRTCGEVRKAWAQWSKREGKIPSPADLLQLCDSGRTMSEASRSRCPHCSGTGYLGVIRVKHGRVLESVARCGCDEGMRQSATIPRAQDVIGGTICDAGDYVTELTRIEREIGIDVKHPIPSGSVLGMMSEPDRHERARTASLRADATRELAEEGAW